MHINQVRLYNIRSLQEMTWTIENSQAAGWHVIIGDNGSGKSTFLRSIALALELIRKAGFGYHRSLSQ